MRHSVYLGVSTFLTTCGADSSFTTLSSPPELNGKKTPWMLFVLFRKRIKSRAVQYFSWTREQIIMRSEGIYSTHLVISIVFNRGRTCGLSATVFAQN